MKSPMPLDQLLDDCERHWSASAAKLYRIAKSSVETSCDGVYVTDHTGKRFIDCACSYGVFVVGHRNPKVKSAVQEQLAIFAMAPPEHSHPLREQLSKRLRTIAPGSWGEIRYTVSGAEAIEQTMRYVLKVKSDRKGIVVMTNSYHGKTLAAMPILGQQHHKAYGTSSDEVTYVPYGDIAALERAVGKGVCAVYVEPILGGAHLEAPSVGYLANIRALCDATGTLMVADEIQTAFGRCGKWFAVEYDGVIPDIMVLSKGLTGGYTSFACALYSEALTQVHPPTSVEEDMRTTGGHPVACASALAAIDYIEDNDLITRSQVNGGLLRQGLIKIAGEYPEIIRDVPGVGMMTGLRLRGSVYEALMSMELSNRGVHAGNSMNEKAANPVLRFYPPLAIERAQIQEILEAVSASLKAISERSNI
ncbi:MAG: aminotransferase class III-fold pyridoxal phosphate-dependent enzyme, partial [Marinobacter sp.]